MSSHFKMSAAAARAISEAKARMDKLPKLPDHYLTEPLLDTTPLAAPRGRFKPATTRAYHIPSPKKEKKRQLQFR